jgi:hypothetical protein
MDFIKYFFIKNNIYIVFFIVFFPSYSNFGFANNNFANNNIEYLKFKNNDSIVDSIKTAYDQNEYSKVIHLYENLNTIAFDVQIQADLSLLYSKAMSRSGDFKQAQKAILRISNKPLGADISAEISRTSGLLKALKGDFTGAWKDYKETELYYVSNEINFSVSKLKNLYKEMNEVFESCTIPFYKRYLLEKIGNFFKGEKIALNSLMKLSEDYLTDTGENRFEDARKVIDKIIDSDYSTDEIKEVFLLKAETYYKEGDFVNADLWLKKYIDFSGDKITRAKKMIEWIHRKELVININANIMLNQKAGLTIQSRNISKIDIKAVPIDFFSKFQTQGELYINESDPEIKNYFKFTELIFNDSIEFESSNHKQFGKIIELGPYSSSESGAYLVMVSGGGLFRARLFMINGLSISLIKSKKSILVYANESESGIPVDQGEFIIAYDHMYDREEQRYKFKTFAKGKLDKYGCVFNDFDSKSNIDNITVYVKGKNSIGVIESGSVNKNNGQSDKKITFFMDKNSYQPGERVWINVYARVYKEGIFCASKENQINLLVKGPSGNTIYSGKGNINENGIFHCNFNLSENASIGRYEVSVQAQGFIEENSFFDVLNKVHKPGIILSNARLFNQMDKSVLVKIKAADLNGRPLTGITIEYDLFKVQDDFLKTKNIIFNNQSSKFENEIIKYKSFYRPSSILERLNFNGSEKTDFSGEAEILIPVFDNDLPFFNYKRYILFAFYKNAEEKKVLGRWPLIFTDDSVNVKLDVENSIYPISSEIPFSVTLMDNYNNFLSQKFKVSLNPVKKNLDKDVNFFKGNFNYFETSEKSNNDFKFEISDLFFSGLWNFKIETKGIWGETVEVSRHIWLLKDDDNTLKSNLSINTNTTQIEIIPVKNKISIGETHEIVVFSNRPEFPVLLVYESEEIFSSRVVVFQKRNFVKNQIKIPYLKTSSFTIQSICYIDGKFYKNKCIVKIFPEPGKADIELQTDLYHTFYKNKITKDDDNLHSVIFSVKSPDDKFLNGECQVIITNYSSEKLDNNISGKYIFDFMNVFKKVNFIDDKNPFLMSYFSLYNKDISLSFFSDNNRVIDLAEKNNSKYNYYNSFKNNSIEPGFISIPLFPIKSSISYNNIKIENGQGIFKICPENIDTDYSEVNIRFSNKDYIGEKRFIMARPDSVKMETQLPEKCNLNDVLETKINLFIPKTFILNGNENKRYFNFCSEIFSNSLPIEKCPDIDLNQSRIKLYDESGRELSDNNFFVDMVEMSNNKLKLKFVLTNSISGNIFISIPVKISFNCHGHFTYENGILAKEAVSFKNKIIVSSNADLWNKFFPVKINKGVGKAFMQFSPDYFINNEVTDISVIISPDPVVAAGVIFLNTEYSNSFDNITGKILGLTTLVNLFSSKGILKNLEMFIPDIYSNIDVLIQILKEKILTEKFELSEWDDYFLSFIYTALNRVVNSGGVIFDSDGYIKGKGKSNIEEIRKIHKKVKQAINKRLLLLDPRVFPGEILALLSAIENNADYFHDHFKVLMAQKADLGVDGLSDLALLTSLNGESKESLSLLNFIKESIEKNNFFETHGSLLPSNWYLFNSYAPRGGLPVILSKALRAFSQNAEFKTFSRKIINSLYNSLNSDGWNGPAATGYIINIIYQFSFFNQELTYDFEKLVLNLNFFKANGKIGKEKNTKEIDINKRLKLTNNNSVFSELDLGLVNEIKKLNISSISSPIEFEFNWKSTRNAWLFLNFKGLTKNVFNNRYSGDFAIINPLIPEWAPLFGVTIERSFKESDLFASENSINTCYKNDTIIEYITINSSKIRGKFYLIVPNITSSRVLKSECYFCENQKNSNSQKIEFEKYEYDDKTIYLFKDLGIGNFVISRNLIFDLTGEYVVLPASLNLMEENLCISKSQFSKIYVIEKRH